MVGEDAGGIFELIGHLVVVLANVGLKQIAVGQGVGVHQSAEHHVALGIVGLRLDSGLTLSGSGLGVADLDIRVFLLERAHNGVVLEIADRCVDV